MGDASGPVVVDLDPSIDEIDAPPADVPPKASRARRGRRRPVEYAFRAIAVAYVFFLVVWPVGLVGVKTFSKGLKPVGDALTDPQVVHAFRLTLLVAVLSVVINTVFGVGISILLVRYRFPGRRVLSALIDLPLSVSPVVVGLALVLVYGGRGNWFGPSLERAGIQVIFATPGIVLATIFVSLPLVVRELVPVLEEIGTEQEQAARSLGASAWQSFWRITFPAIRWATVYGVVLSLARSLGEFGAVKIVSGNFVNQTQTVTLVVEQKYQEFQQQTAYITSFFLAAVSVLCLVIVSVLRPKGEQ
ncbi:MAG: sulfate transporter, inner rane subunit [Acidimicrobiales bacterium]|nr:sulfate transporter, inner rane subunit [Acidimicrobiales bacterium]